MKSTEATKLLEKCLTKWKKALALAAMAAFVGAGSGAPLALAGGYTTNDLKNPKVLGEDTTMQTAFNPQGEAAQESAFVALPASFHVSTESLTQGRANVLGVGVSALDLSALKGSIATTAQICALPSVKEPASGVPATASIMKLESFSTVEKITSEPMVISTQPIEAKQPQVGMLMSLYSETHTGLKQSVSGADYTATKEYFDNKPVNFEVAYNDGPENLREQDVAISTDSDNLITQTKAVSEAGELSVIYNEKGAPISIINADKTAGAADSQSVTQIQTDTNGKITAMVIENQAGRTEVTFDEGAADIVTTKNDGTQERAFIVHSGNSWDKTTWQSDGAHVEDYQPDAVMLFAFKHNAGENPLTQFVAEHNQEIQATKTAAQYVPSVSVVMRQVLLEENTVRDTQPQTPAEQVLRICSVTEESTQPQSVQQPADTAADQVQQPANLTAEQMVQKAITVSRTDGYLNRAQAALNNQDATQRTAQLETVKTEAQAFYSSATGNDRLIAADGLAKIGILECNQGLLNQDQMKSMITYAQESGDSMTILKAVEAAAKSAQTDTLGTGENAVSLVSVAANAITQNTLRADKFGPTLFEVDYARAIPQVQSTFLTLGKYSTDVFQTNSHLVVQSAPVEDPLEVLSSVQDTARSGNLELAQQRAQHAETLRATSLPADQMDDYLLTSISSYLTLGQAEKALAATE